MQSKKNRPCVLHVYGFPSKEANALVPFAITAKAADGSVLASEEFSFDAAAEKIYLTVTADGRIMEDKDYEG